MSAIIPSPILSYVSTSDISSSQTGLTKYQIFFDTSVVGNIIMFEYKLFQKTIDTVPNLVNTSFGYVSVDNAIQTGLVNQYIIAVPAEEYTNDGTSNKTIQVRAYTGQLTSNDVVVTDWSNSLDIYNPPSTPIIGVTYYDTMNELDNIYVTMNNVNNYYTDYDKIKFIVCYWFQDTTGSTVWGVSDPIKAQTTPNQTSYKYLEVVGVGKVSATYPKIYVSVHAVYNWIVDSNYFYSVSYISNELEGSPASNDNTPNIDSVVYNVYVTQGQEPSVPGTQTMTVKWSPPGNYIIPYFNIDHYELYYSLNKSNFVLYEDNISATEKTFDVKVDTLPNGDSIGMICGDKIEYRVNAVTVNNIVEPSANSDILTFFKYSQPVTDLTITNTSTTDDGHINLTVNFKGLNDTTKGCGLANSYVVKINDNVYTQVPQDSLVYISDKSYSISYSGIVANSVGNVKVYLQTTDTNQPGTLMDGKSLTVPYIATNIGLSPLVYGVYINGNTDQTIKLNWTNPTKGDWTVQNYTVQYSIDNANWNTAASILNDTTYDFDAKIYSSLVTKLEFRVIADLTDTLTSTAYTQTSNTKSINTFQFSDAPKESIINWSTGTTNIDSTNTMDINLTFKNPDFTGVNNGLQKFIVELCNDTNNIVDTKTIDYNNAQNTIYNVNFNNVSYSASGVVNIYPYVTDTNMDNTLTYSFANPSYITSFIPKFINVQLVSGISVSGQIVSSTPLTLSGSSIFQTDDKLITSHFMTNTSTTGFSISQTMLENGEYSYIFSYNFAEYFIDQEIPTRLGIVVSNTSGVGIKIIQTVIDSTGTVVGIA